MSCVPFVLDMVGMYSIRKIISNWVEYLSRFVAGWALIIRLYKDGMY